jgi:hypothetical protein
LRLSPALPVLLTVASLIAPAILGYQLRHQHIPDGVAIVIGSVALFLLVVTRMAQLLRQVDRQSKQLSQLVRVDELTGLPNRRVWSVELPIAIERARRDQVACRQRRTVDHLARYGGEEFIVLLPTASTELATMVLEGLRSATPPARPSRPAWQPGTGTRPPENSSPAPTRPSMRPKTPAGTESSRDRAGAHQRATEHPLHGTGDELTRRRAIRNLCRGP